MNTTSQNSLVRALIGLTAIVVLGLFNGCANYKLGSAAPIPFKSIYIKPTTNHSFAPQAQPIVSAQIRETFIHDGRIKLVDNEEEADAVLYVDLTEYKRTAGARTSEDTEVASDFDITLISSVSLYSNRTGDFLFQDRTIRAQTNAYIGNPYTVGEIISYQESERQAMTHLAREMARKVTDEVLSPW
ncbi:MULTISPECIES: LPS assembly lipoprotein LptE [unclassified Lentimonas]|uniref:LPS assembly lipoprotein LptE n=1 Tax=unclassified Lentimonas TaxID=2630993 RepID=UPI00132A8501|nr:MULTISPECIES: LPS assembly lipoprotein LptE [unclassified Lentimonas]CAA6695385.1 Unannotated [Lentimonas sp. CC10]CAA6695794.1 Unannotated [Lentimonas sp. CC19]CAA7072035.1 Unannotated [Lentimonas sp. CC11]